jgi:hypothetical protein
MAVLSGCHTSSTEDDSPTRTTAEDATESRSPVGTPTTPDDGQLGAALQRDLSARLIHPSEYVGMSQNGPLRFLTPQEMASSDAASDALRRYAAEGLLGVAAEHFDSPSALDAICTVMRYRQPSGALHNLRSATHVPSADKVVTFAVPGIPNAVGSDVYLEGAVVGRYVQFVDGPYEYIVGFQPDPAREKAVSQQRLARAAAAWFRRVSTA